MRSTRRVIGGGVAAIACTLLGGVVAPPLAEASQSHSVAGTVVVHGDTVAKVARLGPRTFTAPGPFGVGETTLTLPTDSAPVEVWYPATKQSVAGKPEATYDVADWLPPGLQKLIPAGGYSVTYPSGGVTGVPVAPGRYPLVAFSHGYAGFRDQSTFLTARLASWGFVVAAAGPTTAANLTEVLGGPTAATAKTTDVQDLKATIALMKAKDGSPTSPFARHVDLGLIGAVGHSAGGAAVEALAATDRQVTTFVGLAGATVGAFGATKSGPDSMVPHQPGLLMSGTSDQVVSDTSMISAYGRLHSPKRLILVRGAGHLVFADLWRGRFEPGRPSLHRRRAACPGSCLVGAAGLRWLQLTRSRTALGVAHDPPGGHGAAAPCVRLRRVERRPDGSRRCVPEGGGGVRGSPAG